MEEPQISIYIFKKLKILKFAHLQTQAGAVHQIAPFTSFVVDKIMFFLQIKL